MLSELLTALVEPSPRTRNALNASALDGTDRLAEFLSLPSGEQLRALEHDLARLNEEEALRVVEALSGELKRPFIPIPGPQTQALESAADELLFGGSAGGSKSYLLLGIAANNHTRSLILRRQLTETDGLADDLVKMLGRAGYNKNDREHISTGPRGGERSIKLGGINGPDDWQGYAGRPRDLMCVAAGTQILMASGSYVAIETIRRGDLVATLEGPRRVEKVHPVQHKPCVRLTVRNDAGLVIASQIQAASHPVLTDCGWLSADDLSGAHRPISGRESGNTSQSYLPPYEVRGTPGLRSWLGQWRRVLFSQAWKGSRPGSGALAGTVQRGRESGSAAYSGRSLWTSPPVLYVRTLLRLLGPYPRLLEPFAHQRGFAHALPCAGVLSKPEDSTGRCSFYNRLDDEQPHRHPNPETDLIVDQQCLLQLADAGLPNPNHSPANGQAGTRKHIRSQHWYAHPYTTGKRPIAESCSVRGAPFESAPVGWADVYDLQIEEVNHYISYGGFINQNCFDEAGEFLEVQVVSLLSWLRSTDPNQRCRVVFASNPPRGAEGYWLNEWFAPWIEPTYERPAKDGELRWCIYVGNKTRWVDGPGIFEVDGETYTAKSRTFIRARLQDNPFLSRDNVYLAQLQNRPEPLRSQLLHGDFLAGREDDAWQVIPGDWIQQARQRWSPQRPDMPMTTLGIDVAQGGIDRTTLAPRYGSWFAPLKAVPGDQTPDGLSVATLAFSAMRDGCTVVIDLGGGWGGDAYGHLARHLPEDALVGFMGINPSRAMSVNGVERFANLRAMAWWRFREALDPATGADIALPPDPELAAELAMPRRVPERREILIESKEQIIKRLGRSPDKADAVVMAWCYGTERALDRQQPLRLQTRQNVGYDSAKRRRRYA